MRTFLSQRTVPPGGYVWKVPETGDELVGGTLAQVVGQARAIYARNKLLAPIDLPARIEHDICLHVPPSFCTGTYEEGDEQHRVTSAQAVRKASDTEKTRLRLRWTKERFLAPPQTAERRAGVCAQCALNYRGFCTTCNGLKGYVIDAIGDRTTTWDAKLGLCSVCSCIIKAKVHLSVEAIQATPRQKNEGEYPASCWMKTEGILP